MIASVTQTKFDPAFCVTIPSPLGKALKMIKHKFCAQCHQSIAQIVSVILTKWTLERSTALDEVSIRIPQLNKTTFTSQNASIAF